MKQYSEINENEMKLLDACQIALETLQINHRCCRDHREKDLSTYAQRKLIEAITRANNGHINYSNNTKVAA
jgi:hypothetical protein